MANSSVRHRTGFGHFRTFDVVAGIVDTFKAKLTGCAVRYLFNRAT